MTTINITNKYKFKGINNDFDFCSCCGKKGLKRVVWLSLLDNEGNELSDPEPFGVNCAANAMGWKYGTKSKHENKFLDMQTKINEENYGLFCTESALWRRISYDKGYANRLFWQTHNCINPIPMIDTFFMENNGDFVRVWNKENTIINILESYGFKKYN